MTDPWAISMQLSHDTGALEALHKVSLTDDVKNDDEFFDEFFDD